MRVGEITFPSTTIWGRGDVSNLYETIHQTADALDHDIRPRLAAWQAGTADQQRFARDWITFRDGWVAAHASYVADPILIPVATGSTAVETARGWAQRYNALEQRYRALTGAAPTTSVSHVDVEVTPPSAPERMLNTGASIATAIAVAAGLYLVSRVV